MSLIEDVIFFVMKADATKTICTPGTVNEECARCAVVAIAGKRNCITLDAIRAFITKIGIETIDAVEAIFTLVDDMSVRAIFIAHISAHEIAITAGERHHAVIS